MNVRILRSVLCVGLVLGLLVATAGCFLLPNRPPVASFVVNYDVEVDPMIVELDARSSSDPDDDAITTYMWIFGEDVIIPDPLASSKSTNEPLILVRYPAEGTYNVQLLVIDERGAASDVPAYGTVVLPNPQVGPTP